MNGQEARRVGREALQLAVDICGGQTALAERIGVSGSFVTMCLSGVKPIPAGRCIAIELATDGEVTRYQLRPDVFGPDPSKPAPAAAAAAEA